MGAAPFPDDEAYRLATLKAHQILDTAPERPFDCLVELAAEHFGVPISLVSLVDDDRQWFKAAIGLNVTETPRDAAFCSHAILHPEEIMVVEDATADPRFIDNPLVLNDPSIRFYAGAPIRAANGQPMGTLCVIDRQKRHLDEAGRKFLANLAANASSMLELHRRNAVLAIMSGKDSLTGLANRRLFDNALAEACEAAATGATFGLLTLDLDHFKTVNDTFGHAAGDIVLKEVAQRLMRVMRGKDLIARIGGDEFMVICAGPIDATGLRRVAKRIMDAMTPDVAILDHRVPIRTSIGMALAPLHGATPASLSQSADLALYRSKQAGRDGITLADGTDAGDAATREEELRSAVAKDALTLCWQPYFPAEAIQAIGYEALLHWTRANGEAVSPTDIVAMAEKNGFIIELDRMALRRACAEAAAWPKPLMASVNMSARSFSSIDLVSLVSAVLAETGLPPERLTIELTESTLVAHAERARERIDGLRKLGVRLAMNDFGTGHASLGYLSSFNFDVLKLDKTFVRQLDGNPRAEAVAKAVLALGKALHMAVCAEGVETPEQMRFLQNAGCDMLQGCLLGSPQASIAWPAAQEPAALEIACH